MITWGGNQTELFQLEFCCSYVMTNNHVLPGSILAGRGLLLDADGGFHFVGAGAWHGGGFADGGAQPGFGPKRWHRRIGDGAYWLLAHAGLQQAIE